MHSIFLCLAIFLFTDCTSLRLFLSPPVISPQQRRAMQGMTFKNTTLENVFRSFKAVLQDEGYIIKNQDMLGGLIVAEIQKKEESAIWWALLTSEENYVMSQTFEISVSLEAINKDTVESRMVIQQKNNLSKGGSDGKQILSPRVYLNIYQKVAIEIERRKAQGR